MGGRQLERERWLLLQLRHLIYLLTQFLLLYLQVRLRWQRLIQSEVHGERLLLLLCLILRALLDWAAFCGVEHRLDV